MSAALTVPTDLSESARCLVYPSPGPLAAIHSLCSVTLPTVKIQMILTIIRLVM